MKAKILVLVLLLNVSQAYAWGNREQGALAGFVGGVIATAMYQNHTSYTHSKSSYVDTYQYQPRVKEVHYYIPPKRQHVKVVHIYNYYAQNRDEHHHYRHHERRHHNRIHHYERDDYEDYEY